MQLFANLVLALSVGLSFISPSLANSHQARRHHVHRQAELARRDPGEVVNYKRDFDQARFTYYAVGLGACGQTNQPSDFIVALNTAQWAGGSHCGQQITITANGKTTGATIMDQCPGCPYAGLDMSQGLFEFFADISVGVLTGSWDFGGGSAPAPTTSSPPPPPPPTSSNPPPSTSDPAPTITSQPPSTTSSAPPTTSSASSTSTTVSSSTTSSAASKTSSVPVAVTAGTEAGSTATLDDMNTSLVFIGQLLGLLRGLN